MKTLLFGFWLLANAYWFQPVPGELSITISNIYPVEGELYIAIYDNEDSYMDIEKTAFKKIVPINATSQTIVFDGIPDGVYAISVFQDLNGNGELDTSGLGFPREPYGFSNDARGRFGPPKFKNTKIDFSDKQDINIKLVNDAKE